MYIGLLWTTFLTYKFTKFGHIIVNEISKEIFILNLLCFLNWLCKFIAYIFFSFSSFSILFILSWVILYFLPQTTTQQGPWTWKSSLLAVVAEDLLKILKNHLRIVQNIKKNITVIYSVTGHFVIYIKINLQSLDHYLQKLFMLKKHGKCLRISIALKLDLQQFHSWINFSLPGMEREKGLICLQPDCVQLLNK